MNRKKYLAKNTALFALNSFGTKLIIFLLVPIYTSTLSTAEYGIVDLVTTFATIIVPVIILNINEAVQRFCLDEQANYNNILSVALSVLFFSFILGLLIIPISSFYEVIAPYANLLYLYCITNGACVVFTSYLRGIEKLNHFAICNILITLTGAIFNIIFLVVLKMGIEGYFWAFIISYIIGTLYAIISGRIYEVLGAFKIYKPIAKKMIVYSIILVPNTMMWWIMNASDRIMVTSMIGLAANGIYAVSYKIPSAISTMSTVFNQAWSFSAIKEDKSEDRIAFNRRMYDALFDFQILLTGFLIVIIKPLMRVYVKKSYFEAWIFAVPLLVGYFFMSLGTFFSVQYTVNKDSKGFLFSGTFGAIVNILLNLALIPLLGTMGAAIATMFSYISVFIYRAVDSQKYLKLKVMDRKKILLSFSLIMIALTALITSGTMKIIFFICEYIIVVLLTKNTIKYIFKTGMQFVNRNNNK